MLSGRYAEVNSAEKRPAGSCVFSPKSDGRTDGRNFFIMQCNALHCRRGVPPARREKMTNLEAFEEYEEKYFGGNYGAFCDEYSEEDGEDVEE